jgi:beta-galactosidase
MVQVENEYGSYGSDKEYLDINQKMFKEAGFDGLLYTCDPPADLLKGYLPGLLPAVNGDDPGKIKALVRSVHDGKGPFYAAEWYPAWFDWWGTAHHTVPASKYTAQLDTILSSGISINMYMFHGGTTRGFMNGANFKDGTPYEPEISSYDYDAPLDEAGNPTEKYMAFRKVIEKHLPPWQTLPAVPASKPAIAIPLIRLTNFAKLTDNLPVPKASLNPLTFEDMNQAYGFVLYRSEVEGGQKGTLKIYGLRDYAVVMINGKTAGTLDRRLKQDSLTIDLPKGKVKLEILVENMGRINFGKYLLQNKKGITGNVVFNGREVNNWWIYGFPFEDVIGIRYNGNFSSTQSNPSILRGTFQLNKTGDTYLDMSDWGKGVVWINGHNLGRYWNIGPQQTLYVPVEWLKKGKNDVVVLELFKPTDHLSSLDKPILNMLK